ncbi:hypothetical protein P7H17_02650 [Paenibacillus larvae]|nr:hypothetical protein [Paenibacillus larvae]MDT2285227.1 hypothetical protein [Paenibacillus larvae]
MSPKQKYQDQKRLQLLKVFTWRRALLNHLVALLDVHHSSARQWLQTYQSLGPNGLVSNITECILLRRVKRIAVEDYLAGGGSHMDICKRYGIKSTRQLRD